MPKKVTTKGVLFKVFLTNFLDMLAFGLIIPVLPFLFSTDDTSLFKGLYPEQILTLLYGLMMGSFSIGLFFGAPLLGAVSDRIGRKKVLAFAYCINIAGYLTLALGTYWISLPLLILGRFFPGLLGSTLITIQSSIADVSDARSKAKNFGITGIAFGLGFVSGVSLMVLFSSTPGFSFVSAFIIGALINLVNLLFLLAFYPETLLQRKSGKIYLWTGFQNLKKAFSDDRFRLIFMVIFMLTIGFSFFTQFFQFYLIVKFGFDVQQVGLIFMYIGLLIAFTQGVLLRPISNNFGPRQVLMVSVICFAASYLLILIPQKAGWLYVMMPFLVFFQGITFPTSLAIVSNLADADVQGEIIGINQSVQAFANAIPPIIFGFAVGFNVSFPLWFGAACTLIAWIVFLRFYRRTS